VDGSRKRSNSLTDCWWDIYVRVCVCVCVECIALNQCIPYRHDGGRDDRFSLSFQHTLDRNIYSALVVIIIISCDQKGGTDPEKRRRKLNPFPPPQPPDLFNLSPTSKLQHDDKILIHRY
jgi:hypothetical protein